MDDLTIEPAVDERPEIARPVSVEPCTSRLDLEETASFDSLPPLKPGSIGVRYRLKRRFRTYDAIACVPAYLAQTRSAETIAGREGERIHGDRTYEPLLVGGMPVAASDENLGAIISATVPEAVLQADHPATAERELHAAMAPALDRYLLIDGEVWISI